MESDEILLGVIKDADEDEIEIAVDSKGLVFLNWEYSRVPMILAPAARDQLRELLDRAAMPGQAAPAPFGHCAHCGRDCGIRHTIPCPDGCNNAERDSAAAPVHVRSGAERIEDAVHEIYGIPGGL